MLSTKGIESFEEILERFTGIESLDPKAMGRLAFFLASHHINNPIIDQTYYGLNDFEYWDEVQELLIEARRWKDGHTELATRYEFAKSIEAQFGEIKEVKDIIDATESLGADDGLALFLAYAEAKGLTARTSYEPSPLFPEGREEKTTLAEFVDTDGVLDLPKDTTIASGDEHELSIALQTFITETYPDKKNREIIGAAVSEVGVIDREHHENLRNRYGAKAAALICFKEKLAELERLLEGAKAARKISLPVFEPVSIELFEKWQRGEEDFDEECENLRQCAIEMCKNNGVPLFKSSLVIVRSSAVKSEDGDEHTGAGVYESITVEPSNSEAFRDAIVKVYGSCHSDAAISYQKRIGVEDEAMGLVIQPYLEKKVERGYGNAYYGYIDSRGANPNLIEANFGEWSMLYDKPTVLKNFMVARWGDRASDELHSHPDHTNDVMRYAAHSLGDIAHAVVLAEILFGRPMQLEIVNDNIVQARPLLGSQDSVKIEFPKNTLPRFELSGVGAGDMELKRLHSFEDNTTRRGFVVHESEYAFTVHESYDIFPKEGAVVLLYPSRSGHIQAHCRENGLLCFYVKDNGDDQHALRQALRRIDEGETLRFVSDGYVGRIY